LISKHVVLCIKVIKLPMFPATNGPLLQLNSGLLTGAVGATRRRDSSKGLLRDE
jgi:hypothetical protein